MNHRLGGTRRLHFKQSSPGRGDPGLGVKDVWWVKEPQKALLYDVLKIAQRLDDHQSVFPESLQNLATLYQLDDDSTSLYMNPQFKRLIYCLSKN